MRICLLAAVVIAAVPGCGGMEATVSGTVNLNGKPLTSGDVAFTPVEPGPVVVGMIDGEGRYTLSTGTERGLTPGKYTATVVATELPATANPNEEVVPKLLTPAKYGDTKTSGLMVEVKPGSNDIPLELKSTP